MNSSRGYALDAIAAVLLAAICAGCGVNPDKEFAAGAEAFAAGDYAKAASRYRKGLEERPGDIDALVMLARAELASGEIASAKETLSKAAATNGEDPDILELAAQASFYDRDCKQAYAIYSRLANNASLPAEVRASGWAGMGVVDYFLVDKSPENPELRDRARTELIRATQLDRRNASARYHLAKLYRDSFGYLEAAREQFDYFVHLESGNDPRVAKVVRETIPAIREEIAKKAASRPGAAKRNSVACTEVLAKADAFYRRKDWKSARAAYADALAKDAFSYPAAIGLARSWENSGKTKNELKEALYAYRKACDLSPSAVQAFISAGDVAMKLGNYATAVQLYSKAMAANPANTTVVDGLIRALVKAGSRKSAAVYQHYRDTLPKRK